MCQEYNLIQIKNNLDVILKELSYKNLKLNKEGLYNPSKYKTIYQNNYKFSDEAINNIVSCMQEIKQIYKPYLYKYKINSYGGKHCIERFRKCHNIKDDGSYISNGEFIAAMLLLNIKYKKSYTDDQNCQFLGMLNY
jgi:hypothetical protein